MDSTNWDKLKEAYKSAEDFLADMPIGKAIANVISNPTPQEIGAQVANLGSDISKSLSKTTENPVEAALNYSPMGAMVAFHGSPYKFDKFQMNKIGTGEGAQAYGHGLYFAGAPSTAQHYQELLSSGGNPLLSSRVKEVIASHGGDEKKALAYIKEAIDNTSGGDKSFWQDAYKNFNDLKTQKGFLYKVDLPEENLMLDWDAPLSEQSDYVKEKLQPAIDKVARLYPAIKTNPKATGAGLLRGLSDYRGGNLQGASEELEKVGIKGIKYYDAGSRAAGEGTRNYVIFNEDDIKILERNAEKFLEGD